MKHFTSRSLASSQRRVQCLIKSRITPSETFRRHEYDHHLIRVALLTSIRIIQTHCFQSDFSMMTCPTSPPLSPMCRKRNCRKDAIEGVFKFSAICASWKVNIYTRLKVKYDQVALHTILRPAFAKQSGYSFNNPVISKPSKLSDC
jgi:hypothetical protein